MTIYPREVRMVRLPEWLHGKNLSHIYCESFVEKGVK